MLNCFRNGYLFSIDTARWLIGLCPRSTVIQNIGTSICAFGNKSTIKHGFVNDLPPAAWRIIKTVTRFLKPSTNIRRIAVFWWYLANDVSCFIMGFTLEESGLEVHNDTNPSDS